MSLHYCNTLQITTTLNFEASHASSILQHTATHKDEASHGSSLLQRNATYWSTQKIRHPMGLPYCHKLQHAATHKDEAYHGSWTPCVSRPGHERVGGCLTHKYTHTWCWRGNTSKTLEVFLSVRAHLQKKKRGQKGHVTERQMSEGSSFILHSSRVFTCVGLFVFMFSGLF